jgi:ankyrin repeat protein
MNQPPVPPHQHAHQQQENQQQPQQQGEVHNNDDAPQVEEQQDDQQQDEVEPEVNDDQPPTASGEMKRAVDANDTGKIIILVDAGESPNSVDELGHTIVMRALLKGKLEAAKALFEKGADLLWVSDYGATALHYAARGGDVDCIEWVYTKTTLDVNSTSTDGGTPVMRAIWNGRLEAAKELLKRGANLLRVTNDGWNVLHYAATGGDLDCIEWVLAKTSIDVNSTANNGAIAISCALYNNRLEAANHLVEKEANLFMKHQNGELAIDTRVNGEPDQLGYQVLQHAKELRWSAAKECVLLIESCQSPDRRKVANLPSSLSMDDDVERVFHSAHLAASVLGEPGLSRLIASFIMRTDIIVRDKSVPLVKEPDAVKRRIEAALLKASSSGGSIGGGKRARLE